MPLPIILGGLSNLEVNVAELALCSVPLTLRLILRHRSNLERAFPIALKSLIQNAFLFVGPNNRN